MLMLKQDFTADYRKWLRVDFKLFGVLCWLGAIIALFGYALAQLAIGLFIGCGLSLLCACMIQQSQQTKP